MTGIMDGVLRVTMNDSAAGLLGMPGGPALPDGANDVAGCEVGYGPPFVLDPAQVAAVARGLAEEGWRFGAGHAGGTYEGLEAPAPFYAAAAREGRAVVGAVR
ncbi:hypothetical protein ABT158_16235 [Nonomuraea sp. NPDC001636]|uniref:hypothetical protein n=1 Tax=Nonomuraea sp. NPDC001636 TaxID=3154391 RepID=UPI003326B9BE